jgi:hypothetical protein
MLILSNNHKKTIFEDYSTIRDLVEDTPSTRTIEAFFNQPELSFFLIFFATRTPESDCKYRFKKGISEETKKETMKKLQDMKKRLVK